MGDKRVVVVLPVGTVLTDDPGDLAVGDNRAAVVLPETKRKRATTTTPNIHLDAFLRPILNITGAFVLIR